MAGSLTAWWSRKSDPDRIEAYTRWCFYFFATVEALLGFGLARHIEPVWGQVCVSALVSVHAVVMAVTSRLALDWLLDRRARPTLLLTLNAVVACGVVVLLLVLHATGGREQLGEANMLVTVVVAVAVIAGTLRMSPRHITRLTLLSGPVLALAGVAIGCTLDEVVPLAFATLWACVAGGFAGRVSGWTLAAVRELDEARHAQARLAVAEERLRFGRDLHDVLGRNLSVIALKSELAVQLARRRGTADGAALDQMVEVQRIARESQSELREVVRGYRDTSLLNELAGARGVLRAAGIDCEIDADPEASLPESVRTALGWVVREGATNVLRHSDATRCVIRLGVTARPGTAVLTLVNDGAGERRAGQRSGGVRGGGAGLVGLRERLSALRGTLSTPDPAGPDGDGGSWTPSLWKDRLPAAQDLFVLRAEVPLPAGAADITPGPATGTAGTAGTGLTTKAGGR